AAGSSAPTDDLHGVLHAVQVTEVEPLDVEPLDSDLLECGDRLRHLTGCADQVAEVPVPLLEILTAHPPLRRGGVPTPLDLRLGAPDQGRAHHRDLDIAIADRLSHRPEPPCSLGGWSE